MLHSFEDMIAYVSRDETMHAGELFGSDTMGGGCGLELDRWLADGDFVELEVERLGVLASRIAVQADATRRRLTKGLCRPAPACHAAGRLDRQFRA